MLDPEDIDLKHCCPFALLNAWLCKWDDLWGDHDGPLFCVTHLHSPKSLSYDSWRKAVCAHFKADAEIGIHSLRKGGASWFHYEAKLSEEIVQTQGGWASVETLRKFYTLRSECQIRAAVLAAASSTNVRTSHCTDVGNVVSIFRQES